METNKGYIAICAHFHQPHFQLYKIREDVYSNSYVKWVNFLESCIKIDGFYINMHFSGPFLYWIKNEKPEMVMKLAQLYKSGKIGIIGGLADEAFIQLSTKRDDILFQMREYANLVRSIFSVEPNEWQGIHIPERECGEYLIDGLNRAASLLGVSPVYYFDSETFYKGHYTVPGNRYDYCREFFGFDDCVSKTTYSHLPDEILYYCLRDEIAGEQFLSIPLHKEFRYKFLKTTPFNSWDSTGVSPEQYFANIKAAINHAHELSVRYGKPLEPIVAIFEDAEKFGDWSKNPVADKNWLARFVELVINDSETEFIGLKDYVEKVGYFDTYPVATSNSYPEWENWTAKRGIRGITFGDERLRHSIARLHLLETCQKAVENAVIPLLKLPDTEDILNRIIQNSNECFDLIYNTLKKNKLDAEAYYIVNRVRNIVYQEDSKWASRHPNYGSSPYFDNIGFAYVELAQRTLDIVNNGLGLPSTIGAHLCDWDNDGDKEAFIMTDLITASVDPCGGCINYLYILSDEVKSATECKHIIEEETTKLGDYTSIHKYAFPMVMSETDSELAVHFIGSGQRRERCRNAFRCDIVKKVDDNYIKVCDDNETKYSICISKEEKGRVIVTCKATLELNDISSVGIDIIKKFIFYSNKLIVKISAHSVDNNFDDIYLVPQIVSTVTASDERYFQPCAKIGFSNGEYRTRVNVHGIRYNDGIGDICNDLAWSSKFVYGYTIRFGNGDCFDNFIRYFVNTSCNIPEILVRPAVERFYSGYVHNEQSRLGYASSGISIMPYIKFNNGEAEIEIMCDSFVDEKELEGFNFIELFRCK